ncbi:pentapeptide repeat-containing protein [Nocardia sp. NRRL S-836]|uniref:pentapeptide repeat-containing protein n=1 Tax=Nocardia sp. NRRL S-836 TaxID=1519492 RepID=UPI000A87359C|nr:pentapeptide repeat-containing protein [Nocardia sp. NRRL S-836]
MSTDGDLVRFGQTDFSHCRFPDWYAPFDSVRFEGDAAFIGVQFSGDAMFGGAQFSRHARFDGAQFGGHVGFGGAQFGGQAGFDGAQFGGHVVFGDAQFGGHAQFIGAQFRGHARFDDARFSRHAAFIGARFSWHVGFGGAQFSKDAGFGGAQFSKDAGFGGAQFSKDAGFGGAQFSGDAGFDGAQFEAATVVGPLVADFLRLDAAVFAKRVVVDVEAGALSLDDARFDEGVELQVRFAQMSLRRARFGAASSVSGVATPFKDRAGSVIAADPGQLAAWVAGRNTSPSGRPGGGTSLEPWVPWLVCLQQTDVEHLTLADVDLRWCRFAGAHHLDQLRLEGRGPFNLPPAGWQRGWAWPQARRWTRRRVLAEEHPWRAEQHRGRGWEATLPDLAGTATDPPLGPERLAVLYRSLRKAFEDTKNEPGAGDFYYGEMEARRHAPSTGCGERALLTAYWAISGYGQRAGRALGALMVLIGLLTVLLTGWGLPHTTAVQQVTVPPAAAGQTQTLEIVPAPAKIQSNEPKWTIDRTGKAVRIALGSVIFRDADQKLTQPGMWTVVAGRAFGPLLLALAALAIRARVKR